MRSLVGRLRRASWTVRLQFLGLWLAIGAGGGVIAAQAVATEGHSLLTVLGVLVVFAASYDRRSEGFDQR